MEVAVLVLHLPRLALQVVLQLHGIGRVGGVRIKDRGQEVVARDGGSGKRRAVEIFRLLIARRRIDRDKFGHVVVARVGRERRDVHVGACRGGGGGPRGGTPTRARSTGFSRNLRRIPHECGTTSAGHVVLDRADGAAGVVGVGANDHAGGIVEKIRLRAVIVGRSVHQYRRPRYRQRQRDRRRSGRRAVVRRGDRPFAAVLPKCHVAHAGMA